MIRVELVRLPRGEYEPFAGSRYRWYRRRVELPEGVDTTKLALTLGTLQGIYAVFVNGRKIGTSSSLEAHEEAKIPRPKTYAIPADAIGGDRQVQFAIFVAYGLYMHPRFRIPDRGHTF